MSTDNSSFSERFADFLIRRRMPLLVAAAAISIAAVLPASRLRFDQSLESLYAPDDPQLQNYLESKSFFGGDEFVVVAFHQPDLFLPDGSKLTSAAADGIREFADQLNSVPGVQAESTQHLAQALAFPYGRERLRKLLDGVLVGNDGESTSIALRLVPGLSPEQLGETVRRIREHARDHQPPAHVVGEPVQIHDMFRIVQEDGHILFQVSLGFLAVVLLILFGSIRWVVLPLAVVVVTILWTEAVLVLSRMKLSMVSSMLNSLVTIIGIATVTHVTVHFRENRQHFVRTEALRKTISQLSTAIFWTCATTAVGFGALLSSRITPVQSFGTMIALGTGLVLIASAAILPGGVLLGSFSPDPHDTPAEDRLVRVLGYMSAAVERYPKVFSIGSLLLFIWAMGGLYKLRVETDFSKNFRSASPIVSSLEFVESRLGGAGTWEVNFPAPAELTDDFLDRIRNLAARLRDELGGADGASEPQLTKVIAMTDALDLVPKIPIVANTLVKRAAMLRKFQPEFEPSMYDGEHGRMRLLLRARERQPSESKLQLIDRVESITREEFPDAKATGPFVLLAYLIESLLNDQLLSFGLAILGVGLMMTLAFGSWRIGLISLVPNVFPIVLLVGTMGWLAVPINIGTAMIASVSMGLTVDASIHYLTAYRRARREGRSLAEAIQETHAGVGRTLVFATLALMVGFSVLTLSQFIPLVYFGVLVSAAMLGGLLGNLIFLPLLLRWVERSVEKPENATELVPSAEA